MCKKSIPTLIVPPRITPDTEAIYAAACAAGWEVIRLPNWRIPVNFSAAHPIMYGEPLFADVVAGTLGVALFQTSIDWLPSLPEKYLHRKIALTDLAMARQLTAPTFIKPPDDKLFTARVYQRGQELPADDLLPADTPVLISEPVSWHVEYRCFVAQRQVVTSSPYWRNGQLARAEDGTWPASIHEREEMLAFANTFLSDSAVALPPAFVLDIGFIAQRGWAVVEANSAWGAGIYGCDPAAVLTVLQQAVRPVATITSQEQQWVRALPEIDT